MNFIWSIVLLASLVLAVAGPIFFGHALVEGSTDWFGVAAGCFVAAVVLFWIQARFRRDTGAHGHY